MPGGHIPLGNVFGVYSVSSGSSTGLPLAIEILTGAVTSDTGFTPNVNGFVARVKFKNMIRRSPHGSKYGGYPDPVTNATSLTLTVQDAGFSAAGVPVTWQRTVHGRLPLKNPFPALWSAVASTVPALSWCSNAGIAYYTVAGGTKGGTAPTGTTIGTAYSDGSVSWICIGAGSVGVTAASSSAGDNGYIEQTSGSDLWVYMVLDDPIYATSTVVSASIGGSAYSAAGVNSQSGTITTITNNSTLAVPPPIINQLMPDHQLAQGNGVIEMVAAHYWGPKNGQLANAAGGAAPAGKQMVAGFAFNTYLAATPGTVVNTAVSTSSLSTLVTTSSPGASAVEVFALPNPGTGLAAAGDAYVETICYPWIGPAFSSAINGEAAAWVAGRDYTAYPLPGVGTLARNGTHIYYLATAGVSAASGGPTGTGSSIADGTCVWNFYGSDMTTRNSQNLPARSHFYNDPSSLYNTGYCFVDPSGTASTSAAVYSTYAAAAAAKGTLSNCFPTIYAAAAAGVTFNNTANGSNTLHADIGNLQVYLKAATHSGVGTSLATLAKGSVPMVVQADPAATAGTVLFAEGTVKTPALRMTFGKGIYFSGSSNNVGFDGVQPTTYTQTTTELVVTGMNITLLANLNEFAYRCGTSWYLNNTFATYTSCSVPTGTLSTNAGFHGNNCATSKYGALYPSFACGNRIPNLGVIYDPAYHTGSTPLQAHLLVSNRFYGRTDTTFVGGVVVFSSTIANLGRAFIGSLIVSRQVTPTTEKCGEFLGDSVNVSSANTVVAYNSFVGERLNYAYNDVNGSLSPVHTNFCFVHNITYEENFVYDSTFHIANPIGICCQNYFAVYRVGFIGNVNMLGATNATAFSYNSYLGPVSDGAFPAIGKYNQYASGTAASAEFHTDNSGASAAPSMATDGDYRPVAGTAKSQGEASWLGLRYDLNGTARVNTAGALEAA